MSEVQSLSLINDRTRLIREFYNSERDYIADLGLAFSVLHPLII